MQEFCSISNGPASRVVGSFHERHDAIENQLWLPFGHLVGQNLDEAYIPVSTYAQRLQALRTRRAMMFRLAGLQLVLNSWYSFSTLDTPVM